MAERRLTITIKGGEQHDAPWIVIGGDTWAEIEKDLDEFHSSIIKEKVAAAAVDFKAAYTERRRLAQAASPAPAPQQAQQYQSSQWGAPGVQQGGYQPQHQGGQQPPANPNAPQGGRCRCGEPLEWKENRSGNGASWRCRLWRWNNGNPTPDHDSLRA